MVTLKRLPQPTAPPPERTYAGALLTGRVLLVDGGKREAGHDMMFIVDVQRERKVTLSRGSVSAEYAALLGEGTSFIFERPGSQFERRASEPSVRCRSK